VQEMALSLLSLPVEIQRIMYEVLHLSNQAIGVDQIISPTDFGYIGKFNGLF
jgi:hypothetical protein